MLGVDAHRSYVFMSQEVCYSMQRRALSEQLSRAGMAKSMRAHIVDLHLMLSHPSPNDHPDESPPDWPKWSEKRHEQMPRCAARTSTLKVSDDGFANLILKRELLDSASLRSSYGDRFVSPVDVVEFQVRNLGSAKAVDGT
jgi:CRISPR/Cas system-associated endonuclease/helicase Cas3